MTFDKNMWSLFYSRYQAVRQVSSPLHSVQVTLERILPVHSCLLTDSTSTILVCKMYLRMFTPMFASDAGCDLHFIVNDRSPFLITANTIINMHNSSIHA